MKHIFVNLKRFDIPPEMGGVNRIAPPAQWGEHIIKATQEALRQYDAEFVFFLPEAHLLSALAALSPESPAAIGCQGVFREDTAPDGNFGAFTTSRTANAMKTLGCGWAIIGHCEERRNLMEIMLAGGAKSNNAVNVLLNRSIRAAQSAGLRVLYCIGETAEERAGDWHSVLAAQLSEGLADTQKENICIAYEPIWSIGPGKVPASREEIMEAAAFIKSKAALDVVYGGGLKQENAAMLASIPEIDGGLIALTRFSGEIGFYPDEFLDIVAQYLRGGIA